MTKNTNTHNNNLILNPGLQYINLDYAQVALDYECEIENPTHLLILLNGFQRTRLDFRAFRKKLSKIAPHVATVALDNRYSGETKVTEGGEFSIDVMAEDVYVISALFREKLKLSQCSVLGISMGGMIAQTMAHLFPDNRIENLFLVSTTSGGVGRAWHRPVTNPGELKYENKNIDFESTKKNMAFYFADKFLKNSPLLFDMMCKTMVKSIQKNEENVAAAEQFRVSVNFDGSSFLNDIQADKTIIFSGDEDKIIPLENSHYLNKHISGSELVVYPQTGHLILIEEPDQFVQDVSSYFV